MALVMGRIVHEHADRSQLLPGFGDRFLQGRNVRDVAFDEQRRRQPFPMIAFTSASEASRAISTNATFDPCAQKCSTTEAPMPLPPPVTKTARLLSSDRRRSSTCLLPSRLNEL